MIGKVVTGCVAILPYHTATQDRGSECRDFGFISRIVTALPFSDFFPPFFASSPRFSESIAILLESILSLVLNSRWHCML